MAKAPRFVVYHMPSTMEKKSFYFEHHAKAHAEKLNSQRYSAGGYTYSGIEHYRNNVVYMVTKRNLMSGQEYQEPSNTPGYMSPASEAYWSM